MDQQAMQTAEEILDDQIRWLRDVNQRTDCESANIAEQEQYRRNAETILKLLAHVEK